MRGSASGGASERVHAVLRELRRIRADLADARGGPANRLHHHATFVAAAIALVVGYYFGRAVVWRRTPVANEISDWMDGWSSVPSALATSTCVALLMLAARVALPLAVTLAIFRRPARELGLGLPLRGTAWLEGVAAGLALATLVVATGTQASVVAGQGLPGGLELDATARSWVLLLSLVHAGAAEFFFRGFLLMGAEPVLRAASPWFAMLPWTLISGARDWTDLWVAVGIGAIHTWIAWRARSVYPALLSHGVIVCAVFLFPL